MNRVFRVVWNDVRGLYMVCDENRMTCGKPKSVKNAVLLVAVAAMLGSGSMARAENPAAPEGTIVIGKGETVRYVGEAGNPLQGKTTLVIPNESTPAVKGASLNWKT